ncbi:MAG: hypothetical protein PHE21_00045 [Candidatus Dojkabacteria bacterium]|nr:hypothetical protein [Candidatus Dojkabacteria bacterium]
MSKKNFTISTVATAPSPTTSGTSLVVATGHGTRFATGEPAVICPVNTSPDSTNSEIVTVSNVVGDTLTIVREQESTTARDIQVGDVIFQQISAKDFNDLLTLATHTNRSDLDNVSGTNTGDDASIPVGYLDTDGTLAGDSDVKVPTQKAVKTYADTKIPKTTNITALNETGIADGEVAVFNLTNKDIRTSNVLISTDGTLTGDADTNIPTEKAVKTYIDGTKFVWEGAWVTSTAYQVNDVIEENGSAYICVTAHTSGTFATDLSAGKWDLFVEGVGGNSIQVDSSGGTSDTYGVLSGLVNSSNTVYTVSLGSYVSGSLRVYLNGQLQTQGSSEDWTETTPASGTFTFNTAPSTGDIIIVMYQFSSGSTGNADTLDGQHAPTGTIVGTTAEQTLTSKTLTSPIINVSWDGWIAVTDSWAYASASTITVPSGAASRYQRGDKIKLTQTTVKYFYIVGVADTVLTVTGGSDFTVANAAITSPYYSHVENPIGFPTSFAYTIAITGFSANPNMIGRFSIKGNVCYFRFSSSSNGTSNATTYTISLPVTARAITNHSHWGIILAVDNGVAKIGNINIGTSGATTATLYSGPLASWVNSGDKSANGQIYYEI